MAKKVKHYYILVNTSAGPVFVTGIGDHHTAFWEKTEPPMEFSSYEYMRDVVLGLNLNGHYALAVVMEIELDHQPYLYSEGEFKWKWNKKKKDEKHS